MTETRRDARVRKDKPHDPPAAPGEGNACDVRAVPPELAKLYRDYAGQLSLTLRRMFGDGPPDPDDIAQAAFERLIARGDLSSISNLKAFVWRTARNLFLNEKDRETTRSRHDYEIEHLFFPMRGYDSTPETVISAREQINAVNAVLRTMPEMRRRAFMLHRVDGLSIADVGRRLGISRPAASRHVSRAIADIDAAFAAARED